LRFDPPEVFAYRITGGTAPKIAIIDS